MSINNNNNNNTSNNNNLNHNEQDLNCEKLISPCNGCHISKKQDTNLDIESQIKIDQYCQDLLKEWYERIVPIFKMNTNVTYMTSTSDTNQVESDKRYISNYQLSTVTQLTNINNNNCQFEHSTSTLLDNILNKLKEHIDLKEERTRSSSKTRFPLYNFNNNIDTSSSITKSQSNNNIINNMSEEQSSTTTTQYILLGPKIIYCHCQQKENIIKITHILQILSH